VTAPKLATDAVETLKIKDGNVTAAKLAADARGWAPAGTARNLVALRSTAATVHVTADELVVRAADGGCALLSAVDVSPTLAAAGANGLDAGAEGSNRWYYVWVIYNPTTTTTAGLLSENATAPTLPAGYTHKALVSVARNDGSSNLIDFWQAGREVWIPATAVFSSQAGSTSYASVSLAVVVPPIAKLAHGSMGTMNGTRGMALAASAGGIGEQVAVASSTDAEMAEFAIGINWTVPFVTPQTLFWKSYDTAADYRLTVSGFAI